MMKLLRIDMPSLASPAPPALPVFDPATGRPLYERADVQREKNRLFVEALNAARAAGQTGYLFFRWTLEPNADGTPRVVVETCVSAALVNPWPGCTPLCEPL